MVFQPDFLFSLIVNVSWAGGLWISCKVVAITGNNSVPVSGSGTITVGGHAVSIFAGTVPGLAGVRLTSEVLGNANPVLSYTEDFPHVLGDPFLAGTLQASLFHTSKLPSTFGPGVPIPGQIVFSHGGLTDATLSIALYATKAIKNRVLRFGFIDSGTGIYTYSSNPGIGSPQSFEPLFGPISVTTFGDGGSTTVDFEVDQEAETVTLL